MEPYLKLNLSRKIVNYIAGLRGGLIRIGVNEGRWAGTDYNNRVCKLCNLRVIDDESHFVFRCPALSTFRLLLKNYREFQSEEFTIIFASQDYMLYIDLYNFINNSLEFRKDVLEIL